MSYEQNEKMDAQRQRVLGEQLGQESVPKPSDRHLAGMLRGAAGHIRQLRARVELLEAQMRVVDIFDRALGHGRNQGMGIVSEDFPYSLERAAAQVEQRQKAEAESAPLAPAGVGRV